MGDELVLRRLAGGESPLGCACPAETICANSIFMFLAMSGTSVTTRLRGLPYRRVGVSQPWDNRASTAHSANWPGVDIFSCLRWCMKKIFNTAKADEISPAQPSLTIRVVGSRFKLLHSESCQSSRRHSLQGFNSQFGLDPLKIGPIGSIPAEAIEDAGGVRASIGVNFRHGVTKSSPGSSPIGIQPHRVNRSKLLGFPTFWALTLSVTNPRHSLKSFHWSR